MLAERTRAGTLGESGRRRYSTHVKAIVQVGSARSATYATVLGYTAEIIPIDNPYGLKRGDTFRLRCLLDGKPAAGLPVQAGGETPQGAARTEALLRTDSDGVVQVRLDSAGRWYIKFAKMRPSAAPGLNYESERATLTFEVR